MKARKSKRVGMKDEDTGGVVEPRLYIPKDSREDMYESLRIFAIGVLGLMILCENTFD